MVLLLLLTVLRFNDVLGEYSNINTIVDLTLQHDFGTNTTDDEEYNFCIHNIREKVPRLDIFGPFQVSVMEMSDISLPCSPCRYGSRPLPIWTKLTFENQQLNISSDEKFIIQPNDTLQIKSVKFEDFGTYYCLVENRVGYIWSLEVEAYEDLEVVKAKQWTKSPIHFNQMTIYTKWEHWSDCNKCDQIGKRHRMGYCFVQGNSATGSNHYKALDVYRSGISCNLFLLIHPNVNQELMTLVAKSPIIMLGFCKISCDNFLTSPADLFARLHPQIQEIYKEQMQRQSREFYRDRIQKVKGILPGKPTTFEALALVLLLALESYILIHVWKNREKAK